MGLTDTDSHEEPTIITAPILGVVMRSGLPSIKRQRRNGAECVRDSSKTPGQIFLAVSPHNRGRPTVKESPRIACPHQIHSRLI